MNRERESADDVVIRPAPPAGAGAGGVQPHERVVVEREVAPGGPRRQEARDRDAAGASDQPGTEPSGPGGGGADAAGPRDRAPLLDDHVAENFLGRWSDVQARFVDDPRGAVLAADDLVAELVRALADRFSRHRDGLEEQWSRGAEPSTEDLRLALQQYRSFFQRLLAS
jgi:hypothetical protein